MRRLLSICNRGTWLAVVAVSAVCHAQEPVAEPGAGPAAPRTDPYSVYTDAFYNAETLGQAATESAPLMDGLFRGPRYWRMYVGYDILSWNRSGPSNLILTRVTPNIFENAPENGETAGAPLYGFSATADIAGGSGLIRVGNPNDSDRNARFDVDGNNLGNINDAFLPNLERMQTDDFDLTDRMGHRPKIGVILPSGNKVEFSYFYVEDFRPAQLVDDVSGAAFLMKQISDGNSPFKVFFQRFGYINAPFTTINPIFGGERRRQVGDDPSFFPHSPLVEQPIFNDPIAQLFVLADPSSTSRDIPREPTVNDPDRLNVLTGPEEQATPSLLWRDGELAVARWASDVQGAELMYRRSIFEYNRRNWVLTLLAGVRYVALDESFSFFFADIAGFDTQNAVGSNVAAFSPFDRFIANNPLFDQGIITNFSAQPSNQTYATVLTSVDNDFIGPEIGIDAKLPFWNYFAVDLMGKAGFGANFLNRQAGLIRGDGFVGYDFNKQVQSTSGIFEGQFGLEYAPAGWLKVRGGWEFMWLVNVATAIDNLDLDLEKRSRPNNNSNVLFNGFYGGVELTF